MAKQYDEQALAAFDILPGEQFPNLSPQLYFTPEGTLRRCLRCRVCGRQMPTPPDGSLDDLMLRFMADHRHRGQERTDG